MPSLAEVIAAGPQSGGEEFVSRYLGVPEGYVATRQTEDPERPAMIAPRYAEGEQYQPGGLSVEDRARLQQQLDRSGMFRKGEKYRLGVWDDATTDAYGRLLQFANQQGYDAPEALKVIGTLTPEEYDSLYGKGAYSASSSGKVNSLAGPGVGPGAAADVRPGVITQGMSGEDLRFLADRTARKQLGRKLAPDELERFSGAYQSMLAQANQRQAAAGVAAEGGANVTYSGPTDPEAFATGQLEKLDPVAAGARKQLDAFKAISGMLGGIGGGSGGV